MIDQYGTVADMPKGLMEVVTPYLRRTGWIRFTLRHQS